MFPHPLQDGQWLIPVLDHERAADGHILTDPLGRLNPRMHGAIDVQIGYGIEPRAAQRDNGEGPSERAPEPAGLLAGGHQQRSAPEAKQRRDGEHVAQELGMQAAGEGQVHQEPGHRYAAEQELLPAPLPRLPDQEPQGVPCAGQADDPQRPTQGPAHHLRDGIPVGRRASVLPRVGQIQRAARHHALG